MNETKFTPGPWRWNKDKSVLFSRLNAAVVDSKEDEHVGAVVVVNNANANLIAAAPELYNALELLVNGFYEVDSLEQWEMWIDQARAALAKARGEA